MPSTVSLPISACSRCSSILMTRTFSWEDNQLIPSRCVNIYFLVYPLGRVGRERGAGKARRTIEANIHTVKFR
jgi:hypothetical protein